MMNRCVILIPLNYSDGTSVPGKVITQIKRELDEAFDGHTVGGTVQGTYRMADRSMACDTCLEIWVAIDPSREDQLRKMTAKYARILKQESIWFEVTNSRVDFIRPDDEGGT
jgi:hypothetical protein